MAQKQKLELTWIGKEKRARLEPRVLVEDAEKSYHASHRVTENDFFDNRLIRGDNLLALKALEQDFTGTIKCIYIDPPYNTGEIMRQVVAMLSQLLDRINVIGVEGLHEIAKVEQARLKLISVTGPAVLIIGLEGHSLPKRRVCIERLDRAHDHRFDEFVRHEDEPCVGQASCENFRR